MGKIEVEGRGGVGVERESVISVGIGGPEFFFDGDEVLEYRAVKVDVLPQVLREMPSPGLRVLDLVGFFSGVSGHREDLEGLYFKPTLLFCFPEMGRSPSKSLHQDEIEEFALECGLDDERISKLYNQFDEIGELTYEEFRRRTKVKDNPFSRNLFESLNQNGKGKMNFREFLIGYAMLKDPQVSFHERAKLMFYILDHKKCGEISREDILLTLQDLLADFPEVTPPL